MRIVVLLEVLALTACANPFAKAKSGPPTTPEQQAMVHRVNEMLYAAAVECHHIDGKMPPSPDALLKHGLIPFLPRSAEPGMPSKPVQTYRQSDDPPRIFPDTLTWTTSDTEWKLYLNTTPLHVQTTLDPINLRQVEQDNGLFNAVLQVGIERVSATQLLLAERATLALLSDYYAQTGKLPPVYEDVLQRFGMVTVGIISFSSSQASIGASPWHLRLLADPHTDRVVLERRITVQKLDSSGRWMPERHTSRTVYVFKRSGGGGSFEPAEAQAKLLKSFPANPREMLNAEAMPDYR